MPVDPPPLVYTTEDLMQGIYQGDIELVEDILTSPDADVDLTQVLDGNNVTHEVVSNSMWSVLPLLQVRSRRSQR